MNEADQTRFGKCWIDNLLATSDEAVVSINTDHEIILFNQAAETMFGFAAGEILGQPMSRLLPKDAQHCHNAHVQSFADSQRNRQVMAGRPEIRGRRQDGTEFPARAAISKVKHGDDWIFTAIIQDLTEQHDLERTLRTALSRLTCSAQAKSAFLASVSHELRTPLNAIIGFAELMTLDQPNSSGDGRGNAGDDTFSEYSNHILEGGHRLLNTLNRILDLSEMTAEGASADMHPLSVPETISVCIDGAWVPASDKALSLAMEVDQELPDLLANKSMIVKIISNLLDNAIAYTPDGGQITVKATVAADGGMMMSVKDTGIGMTEIEAEMALEPFTTIGSVYSRSQQGPGLGLALVRAFAKAHGGSVNIHSEPNAGTTVSVLFPPERVARSGQSRTPKH